MLRNETLRTEFPLLCRAAAETGGVAIQNRGTIGGNIANARPPPIRRRRCSSTTPSSSSCPSAAGGVVPYERFHTGYKQMDLAPDELIVRDPAAANATGWMPHYRKVGTRRAQAISKVCFAGAGADATAAASRTCGSRSAASRRPWSAPRTPKPRFAGQRWTRRTCGAAVAALERDIAPIDDIRSTARYRHHVAGNLLTEFLARLTAA